MLDQKVQGRKLMNAPRRRQAQVGDRTLMFLFVLMCIFWFGVLIYDVLTNYGFQHSAMYEPITNVAHLVLSTLFIVRGLSCFSFSQEYHELQRERIIRHRWLQRFQTG
ncbi:MAG: hypothetical protein M3506_09720, partial [Chloroflexota bacterium]|nr:hypothetical protein [Chloroflexota bacterium]